MPSADSYRTALSGFASLVEPANEDASIDLAAAALAIARTEYPALDISYYLGRLDALARRVRSRMRSSPTARETIALLNRVLFDEEGLRGNRDDYYDPRNSFLNDVLDRKLGIPITLSVIYLDVARRVGFPIAGTGMPGHFLLKHYDVMAGEILIDPFNRGRIVGNADCQQRLNEIYSGEVELQPEFLKAVTHREILTRVLNNLRQIYLPSGISRKACEFLTCCWRFRRAAPNCCANADWCGSIWSSISALPRTWAGICGYSLRREDADDVSETLDMLRQLLARLN